MAKFSGVYPPMELTPAPCGLLSVARVMTHTSAGYDEKWVRGFANEFESQATVRLLTRNDDVVSGGELSNSAGLIRYFDVDPFFIEVEDDSSTFGLLGVDRLAKIKRQLECVTQKAVERELANGQAAVAGSSANPYLASTAASVVHVGAVDPYKGLMHLEEAISDSDVGENGTIHVTRDVASILSYGNLLVREEKNGKPILVTYLGTEVVVGSGYTGTGPLGNPNATPSETNKWMYATGPVDVHLGKIEVVNENLGQGIDANINDMLLKAVRPAVAYFDPSMHMAMRVTLPAS